MDGIKWGIIGCGDVTELKSGPAFNKVADSKLVAVMRRNAALAEDYARRHHVPKWYNNADELIADPEVNAIYIATPPDSHLHYTLAALRAGKPVYVEKPMTLNYAEAKAMEDAAVAFNQKIVVAHYRRAQPYFQKIKALLEYGAIGQIRFARVSFFEKPLSDEALQISKIAWRVDPRVSGGGLFHDLAPHQLDLAYNFFGEPKWVKGISVNQSGLYAADDLVTGSVLFESGTALSGTWCFNAAESKDMFEIFGTEGSISFPVFGKQEISVIKNGELSVIPFEAPRHVQQPMIEKVVQYFLNKSENPCSVSQGAVVMQMIDAMTGHGQ